MTTSSPTPVLAARGLTKRYGQVTALDGADFELLPGEILAVIGDNGAGKSTLIKALSGALVPDSGEIKLDGKAEHFKSPSDARKAGIETVYQDLAVAPAMTIAENLFLGREIKRGGLLGKLHVINKKQMLDEAVKYMQELKIGIRSMKQAVETLSGGQRQGVAVARSAAFAKHVVILDEPTAACLTWFVGCVIVAYPSFLLATTCRMSSKFQIVFIFNGLAAVLHWWTPKILRCLMLSRLWQAQKRSKFERDR